MSDILSQIVERRRLRIPDIRPSRDEVRNAAAERQPFRFSAALRRAGVNVISEIKAASPSAGSIVSNPDVEAIASEYRDGGAAAISVVTESDFFHGSHEWLRRASRASGLPVLMKDFIVHESQVFEGVAAGADAMLLLASLHDAQRLRELITLMAAFGCDALVEVHDEEELERAIEANAAIIGVNNRNLRDFTVDLGTSERLAQRMPEGTIRVAESGIRTREDVERLKRSGFDGFLVGESLLRQKDRRAAVEALTS